MADKNIGIIIDVKSESVKFATDKTIGLREQLRLLKKEQSKLLTLGQEGSKEFTIVSNAINNTTDDLERSNQKAKDLFGTFSLIPGPVGDIAGKINGVLSSIKLLSGFNIGDIKNQFKEFGKDILDIGKSLLGLKLPDTLKKPVGVDTYTESLKNSTKATEALASANEAAAGSVSTLTAASNAQASIEDINSAETLKNTVEVTNNSTALQKNTEGILYSNEVRLTQIQILRELRTEYGLGTRVNAELVDGEVKYNASIVENGQVIRELTEEEKRNTSQTYSNIGATNTQTVSQQQSTVATNTNTKAAAVNTVGWRANAIALANNGKTIAILRLFMNGLTISTTAAAVAVTALDVALSLIGWTLIIGLVTALFTVFEKLIRLFPPLVKFFQYFGLLQDDAAASSKNAKDNTEAYTKALEKNSETLNKNLQAIDYQTKKKKLLAEINGASTAELFKITQNGLEQEKQLYSKQIGDLQVIRSKANKDSKLSAEERQKTIESIDKKIVESSNNYVKKAQEIDISNQTEKLRVKKEEEKATETFNNTLLELQNKFKVQTAINARDKEDIELQIAKKGEEDKIKNLEISETRKAELLKQLNANYAAILLQNGEKRNQEDAKIAADNLAKALQFQRERSNILLAATGDEIAQQKEQRRQKYEDDLKALKENTEYLKLGIFDRAMLLIALQKKLNLDLKKIDDDKRKQDNDDFIKKLDDELKFLQIANEAKREGTKQYFDGQRQLLDTSEQRELAQLDLTEDQKTKIKEKYVKLRKDLDKQELDSYLQMATAVLGAASNIVSNISEVNQMQMEIDLQKAGDNAEKQEEIKKKYFEKNKKTQIAQAIIGTLQAAIQAYQSLAVIPVVGPALGAVAAAAALVFGYKKVSLIKQQEYQSSSTGSASVEKPAMPNYGRNYEDGGMIDGPRHAQGGVMIEAEGGEAVMTRGAVTMFSPLLSAMNQIGGGTSFQPGAVGAARPDSPLLNKPAENQAPLIMKTYVVENELTSIQQRQARLKDLSTL